MMTSIRRHSVILARIQMAKHDGTLESKKHGECILLLFDQLFHVLCNREQMKRNSRIVNNLRC